MNYENQILEIILNFFDLSTFISIILIIISSLIVIKIGEYVLSILEKRYDLNLTAHYLFKDLFKYLVIILAITWILQLIGINIQNIVISLGIVGIAVGFASKDIVSNFISGLFVITDKQIEVGKVIEVDGQKGTIRKVGFRNTYLINQDQHRIIVPNSVLSTKPYKIYKPNEDHRLRVVSTLPNYLDLLEFEKEFNDIIMQYEQVDKTKKIFIRPLEFTDSGPKVEINFWVNEFKDIMPTKAIILNEMNELISKHKEENIYTNMNLINVSSDTIDDIIEN
ncbi:MAG: mechanosensitive ion channel [Methanobrevibacter sp.]|jgi:small-conductance mechanosensitive channel|nr:mechanosensitive ion channel [Methanobrevibacter sp.]MEE0925692.1 mechanosensitive ion channel [Methanobrevibacter sp.]